MDGNVEGKYLEQTGTMLFDNLVIPSAFLKNPGNYPIISFRTCTFHNFKIAEFSTETYFHFYNCTFLSSATAEEINFSHIKAGIAGREANGGLYFEKCIFEDVLAFNDINIKNGALKLLDCDFKSTVLLDNVKFHDDEFPAKPIRNSGFVCKDCRFSETLTITNSELNLLFDDTIIKKNLVSENNETGRVQLTACTISGNTLFRDCSFSIELHIIGGQYGDGFMVEQFNIPIPEQKAIADLKIRGGNFENGFHLECLPISRNSPNNIGTILITCNDSLKGNLQFTNAKMETFEMSGGNTSGNIFLENCQMTECNLQSFINKGSLSFFKVSGHGKKSLLKITSSVLGKFFLANSSLRSFVFVEVNFSNFSEMTVSNVDWFDPKIANIHLVDTQTANGIKISMLEVNQMNRDLFRQLKNVLEKQGDYFSALVFRKMEMIAYRRLLSDDPNLEASWGDRMILKLSWTNDYGDTWIRPVWLLFTITLVFYILMLFVCCASFLFGQDPNTNGIFHNILDQSYNFFILLNPTRRTSELFAGIVDRQWALHTLDFLERVILSYLIFQIITAFRKYLK